MTLGEAVVECVTLVCEAVDASDANLAAIRHPDARPDRVLSIDWEPWYARARVARDAIMSRPDAGTVAVDEATALGAGCRGCADE